MKLSMWTLYDWLEKKGFRPTAAISDGKPHIEGLRFPQDGQEYDPTGDFAQIVSGRAASGGGSFQTALVCGVDMVLLPSANAQQLCNEVLEAFSFFDRWERRLLMALLEGRSLQDLLDIAHQVFQRPMFIKSDSSWVFAITGGYDISVHPDWARLEDSAVTKQSDFNAVKAVSLDPEFQMTFLQHYPAILMSPFYQGNVLHANVWLEDRRVCEIVAVENGRPFVQGDVHLMYQFSAIVERYMKSNRPLYLSLSGLSAFFVDLIDGQPVTPLNFDVARKTANWGERDDLTVVCIGGCSQCETPIMSVLRERLMDTLRYSCTFSYNSQIVCVVDVSKNDGYDALIQFLSELIPQDAFRWGVSYEFTGIEQVPDHYRQAAQLLQRACAAGKTSLTMYEAVLSLMEERLNSLPELQSLVHPDVRRLQQIDRQSESQYVKTLLEYLICGGNYTDTAQRLGLHRNSLIYRMTRIQEIIHCNLDDLHTRKVLLFSLLISNNIGV